MKNLIANNIPGYSLLDSGFGKKLEILAGITVERPCPQAIWAPTLKESVWKKATSVCIRKNDGGGAWKHLNNIEPKDLQITWESSEKKMLKFDLKLTSFGHCGIFFEQSAVWEEVIKATIELEKDLKRPPRFLNLFGYTGCASLAAVSAGATVFHVDSSKGVLKWCEQNAKASKLNLNQIKLVHEDAMQFVKHSLKKGFKYDGILADPPSWGHGANKEVWEFEKMIFEFSKDCFSLLEKKNSFFILTSHTHGVQSEALKNLMASNQFKKTVEIGELGVHHLNDSRILPAGIYALAKNIN